jgi:hypothetical protein
LGISTLLTFDIVFVTFDIILVTFAIVLVAFDIVLVVSMDILARDLELGGLVDGVNVGRNFQTW